MYVNPGLTQREPLPPRENRSHQHNTHLRPPRLPANNTPAAPLFPADEFYVWYTPRDVATCRRVAREGARGPQRTTTLVGALRVWLPILFPFCRMLQGIHRLLLA
jgi:hypothetical protein